MVVFIIIGKVRNAWYGLLGIRLVDLVTWPDC